MKEVKFLFTHRVWIKANC